MISFCIEPLGAFKFQVNREGCLIHFYSRLLNFSFHKKTTEFRFSIGRFEFIFGKRGIHLWWEVHKGNVDKDGEYLWDCSKFNKGIHFWFKKKYGGGDSNQNKYIEIENDWVYWG